MNWQPIETAPWDKEVLLTGRSGCTSYSQRFVINGYRIRDWHGGRWNDITGDSLYDNGWYPTHWAELLSIPDAQIKLFSNDLLSCGMSIQEIVEKLKEQWYPYHHGGCKMLSLGDDCRCHLCLIDNLAEIARR